MTSGPGLSRKAVFQSNLKHRDRIYREEVIKMDWPWIAASPDPIACFDSDTCLPNG